MATKRFTVIVLTSDDEPYIIKTEEPITAIFQRLENPPKHGLVGVEATYGTVYFNPAHLISLSWLDEKVSEPPF